MKWVLGIESSCDDTSVALVNDVGRVLMTLTASQDLAHQPFGGVVPEIAGRSHMESLVPLIDELFRRSNVLWDDISAIAVTNRPGLVGSLIVGLVTAKTLAFVHKKPLIGVHHIEGHVVSAFLYNDEETPRVLWQQPYISLVVSGGHTQLYYIPSPGTYELLGKTQDDAAGEAFDKFAKILGLGYPGGVQVDRLAKAGDRQRFDFPRAMIKEKNFHFSFSGLKASAQRWVIQHGMHHAVSDVCASYQEAIVDVLIAKLEKAITFKNVKHFTVAGGVSANSRLRERVIELAQKKKLECIVPPLKYCTDNAAMIAYAGGVRVARGEISDYSLKPIARVDL
ncbi:MAG: tRNA (adenosine(37)-N6)-threonylcarbamoyltransferase complex transferase subunit TsaD [Bdellovibrionaceae bacterium]|nr:tRNA (adenosine(37)-N6)-threonylcarbamoyltransferase complex transferase subunit TsaD [Pseudobdellovibrionaceae bacterium]